MAKKKKEFLEIIENKPTEPKEENRVMLERKQDNAHFYFEKKDIDKMIKSGKWQAL